MTLRPAGDGVLDLGAVVAHDCPRMQNPAASIYERCGVHFPELPRLFMRGDRVIVLLLQAHRNARWQATTLDPAELTRDPRWRADTAITATAAVTRTGPQGTQSLVGRTSEYFRKCAMIPHEWFAP